MNAMQAVCLAGCAVFLPLAESDIVMTRIALPTVRDAVLVRVLIHPGYPYRATLRGTRRGTPLWFRSVNKLIRPLSFTCCRVMCNIVRQTLISLWISYPWCKQCRLQRCYRPQHLRADDMPGGLRVCNAPAAVPSSLWCRCLPRISTANPPLSPPEQY